MHLDLLTWLFADRYDAALVRVALMIAGALLATRIGLWLFNLPLLSGPHDGSL